LDDQERFFEIVEAESDAGLLELAVPKASRQLVVDRLTENQ
jgi:hypothetical protein